MEKNKDIKTKEVKIKKESIPKISSKKERKKNKKNFTDLEGNVINKEKISSKKKSNLFFIGHLRKHRKRYFKILFLIIFVALIIFSYTMIRNYIINKKYAEYEEKMNAYGFSLMYNNESAKSSEKVTKLEMIKLVISTIYNTTEVESIGFPPKGEFEGDEWVNTAIAFGIIDKKMITKDNYDDKATLNEAITTYLNARNKKLNIPIGSTKEASFKNLQSYTPEERRYINDSVENGLLENSKKKIHLNSDIIKGEFNSLVIKFVEKYNTIIPEGETMVTKKESLPKNAAIYPYVLYSVGREVYEYKGVNEGGVDYKSPVETYKYEKDSYEQMQYRSEQYYNTILNVDYNNITLEKFKEEANRFLRYTYPEEDFSDYVDYVKENKIIVEGTAKVQLPIFYLDGIKFRARIKLSFEIKNSNTDKNLIFGDLDRAKEVTYKNKKYELYIDAPMGTTILSNALRMDKEPIIDNLVSNGEAKNTNEI